MKNNLISKSLTAVRALLTRKLIIESDSIPYEFHQVPLVETSVFVKPTKPWGWPTHLQVEPTALCNLHCTFCPVTTGMERTTGCMNFETFKKAIDEIGDYLLSRFGTGESLF